VNSTSVPEWHERVKNLFTRVKQFEIVKTYLLLIRSSSRNDVITSFQMGANCMASTFGLRKFTDSLKALQNEEIQIRHIQ